MLTKTISGTAAVVGSGPNGLAAAVTLARAGIRVTVYEAKETIGGGTRTEEIVQTGVLHDICSAIHPMAFASPFFKAFALKERMEFVVPEASYANPLDGEASPTGRAAMAYLDLDRTAEEIGKDGEAYKRFYKPLIENFDGVLEAGLGGSMLRVPEDLRSTLILGARAFEQGSGFWNARFKEAAAPALITGVAAHSIGKMPRISTSAVGTILGLLGHASGYPVPVGGSKKIAEVMVADLLAHGGKVETNFVVENINQLPGYDIVMFDTSARALAQIAADKLPYSYVKRLQKFKYGDGVAKVDFVLNAPIPWKDQRIHSSATVHLGGSRQETAFAEMQVAKGVHPEKPYVLLAQPDSFDVSRNPKNAHAIWSYTHVPKGSEIDMKERVINQIERFAPGFRDTIVAVRSTTAKELEKYNLNYVGGDISSGQVSLKQLLARPVFRSNPWQTPTKGIYLVSSATPPGPGVHGLSGWYAAKLALKNEYGLLAPSLRKIKK